jgi:hypothetical protein
MLYGMKPDEDILAFLLKLNLELPAIEANGENKTLPRPACHRSQTNRRNSSPKIA